MAKRYKTLLYIGRFQPFHYGHKITLDYALEVAEQVVVGLGSCDKPPSERNPFDISARQEMIASSVPYEEGGRLHFINLYDRPETDDAWVHQVRLLMEPYGEWALIGVNKDASTYYLSLFSGIEVVHPPNDGTWDLIDATLVRKLFFHHSASAYNLQFISGMVPRGTYEFLKEYVKTERWSLACKGTYL